MELHNEEKTTIIRDFGMNPQDTGSTEVQIALLTSGIKKLTEHCKENKKDFSSQRGLIGMVCQRKKLLQYFKRRTDAEKYKQLIGKLGLRK